MAANSDFIYCGYEHTGALVVFGVWRFQEMC